MFLDREEREELNELSRVVFGSASRWQRYVKGVWVGETKEIVEEIPGENGAEPTTQTKRVQVMGKDGKQTKSLKRYTLEEVKNLMLTYKAIREQFMENQKKLQAEADAKKAQEELQKRVQDSASGTAVS